MRCLLIASFLLIAALLLSASDVIVVHPTLTNVENVPLADLDFVIQEVNRLNPGTVDDAAEMVRSAFQERGYFKVLVADPFTTVRKKDGQPQVIDVTLAVTSGEKYRLKNIGFTETTAFSVAELRRAFTISDGETLDLQKIVTGLFNLRQLYAMKGYVNFIAIPKTEIDEPMRAISLMIDLDSGPVFQVGKLTVRGEESELGTREKLLHTWKSYEGKVYDPTTLQRFLRDLHARPNLNVEHVFEISSDPQAHVVNVYLTLADHQIL